MLTLRAPMTSHNPQLVFPWSEETPSLFPLLPEAAPLAPQQLWATLSTVLQTQTRQTILHILQETLYDHPAS